MKSFIFKYQTTINIVLPIIITGSIFYSGILEQKIYEIRTNYLIDVVTLNNSFITLSVNAASGSNESYQKTYTSIKEQIQKFNDKYSTEEKELKAKETFKWWIDWVPYLLILILLILNIISSTIAPQFSSKLIPIVLIGILLGMYILVGNTIVPTKILNGRTELLLLILGWFLGIVTTFLNSYLSQHRTKSQFLMETKRAIYAKLLSTKISEESYPREPSSRTQDDINKFNEQLREWRKNRNFIKGIAAEALLLAENTDLRNELSQFISTSDPNRGLYVEELMRKDMLV